VNINTAALDAIVACNILLLRDVLGSLQVQQIVFFAIRRPLHCACSLEEVGLVRIVTQWRGSGETEDNIGGQLASFSALAVGWVVKIVSEMTYNVPIEWDLKPLLTHYLFQVILISFELYFRNVDRGDLSVNIHVALFLKSGEIRKSGQNFVRSRILDGFEKMGGFRPEPEPKPRSGTALFTNYMQ